jgi:hypothetical protein
VVVEDLHAVLDPFEGEAIELRVLRGTEERTVTIRFGC